MQSCQRSVPPELQCFGLSVLDWLRIRLHLNLHLFALALHCVSIGCGLVELRKHILPYAKGLCGYSQLGSGFNGGETAFHTYMLEFSVNVFPST